MDKGDKITMDEVEKYTRLFLKYHWAAEELQREDLPKCWEAYRFIGGIPYGDRQGCYALIEEEEVLYIGLGASRGWGIYKECGIGARLSGHVLRWDRSIPSDLANRVYKPIGNWRHITQICTFGFPSGYGYLACALEAYLVSNLEPKANVTKTSSRLS